MITAKIGTFFNRQSAAVSIVHFFQQSCEVFGCVYAYRLGGYQADLYPVTVFEPAQLFERFGLFKHTLRQSGYLVQDVAPVTVNADMFEIRVARRPFGLFRTADIRDDAAAEVEGIAAP